MKLAFAILLLLTTGAQAQQPNPLPPPVPQYAPRLVPYVDVTRPAEHWRMQTVWQLKQPVRYGLFGGAYPVGCPIWVPKTTWVQLYPEQPQ